MSESRRHDAIALAVLTALIALVFLDVLLGFGSLFVRDLAFYFYPAKHVFRETVLGGEFPYWNRLFSAGQPMAANPEHEVFYPLNWLVLLPSYDFGFRLLVVLHVAIAAWSMYALLRSIRLRATSAFLGALSFALGGTIGSMLALLPYLFILAWLPLTCLYTRRFLLFRKMRDAALAAFFLGLQLIIGEPTTVLQTGLLLGLFAIWFGMRRGRVTRAVASVGATCIAALLVSAVQTLPSIDHARDSVRGHGFTFRQVSPFSMPLAKTAEWLYPNVLGHQQIDGRRMYWGQNLYPDRLRPYVQNIYPGLLIGALALAGLIARIRGSGLVLSATLLSIVVAMGANTPLLRILYDLGIARSIRYPEKFILLGTFALTVFGAIVLERLLRGDERVRKAALAVAGMIAIVAAIAAFPTEIAIARRDWFFAALRSVLLLLLLAYVVRLRARMTVIALTAFVLLDLSVLIPEVAPRISPDFFRETPPLVTQLPRNHGAYRVFPKSVWDAQPGDYLQAFPDQRDLFFVGRNAFLPATPALYGLQTVVDKDYDLTALQATDDFTQAMFALSKYRDDWASVAASMSNAWFGTEWAPPAEAIARAGGDARLVQPLRLIALPHHPRYYFADRVEGIRDADEFVSKLASARFGPGTAFVESQSFNPGPGIVRRVDETANSARIEVESQGRAFLIMSVTPHKYWTIAVDGMEAPAVVTNVGYQGVEIGTAGRHLVEMRYRNPLVAGGGAITICALLAIFLAARTMRAL